MEVETNMDRVVVGHITGSHTGTVYKTETYADGMVEVLLCWPDIPWNCKDQLVAQEYSHEDAIKAVERRESLIRLGHSVM